MSAKPARRPHWALLAGGLMSIVVGAVRLIRPHDWASFGGLGIAFGAICVGLYVDRALRWLKDRP